MSRSSILRTLVCMALLCACLFTLIACDDDGFYDPIDSTSREEDVIAEIGDEEVNYELFRYLFMARVNEFDGGDHSKWNGEGGAKLWEKACNAVVADICDIYAVFSVSRTFGIDPYSDTVDTMVNQNIVLDIDGGMLDDGTIIKGYGSIEKYEEEIRKTYSTDAVRRLLYRYMACLELLDNYIVNNRDKGTISVTDEKLDGMLESGKITHINRVYIAFDEFLGNRTAALEKAQKMHQNLLDANGDYDKMVQTAFKNTVSDAGVDPSIGWWFGRSSTSERDFPAYYHAIFNTPKGEISDIIEERDGFYIVYGMGNDADLSDKRTKATLTQLYLEEYYWEKINIAAAEMQKNIILTDDFYDMTPTELITGE